MRITPLILTLLLAAAPAFAGLSGPDLRTAPRADVEAALPDAHPSAYFHYAERLYAEDDREEAITWMYVGRIRYLLHLHSNPVGAGDDTEEFRKLTAAVLYPAMEWASNDIDMLIGRLDAALAWDAEHPNGYTPRDSFKAQWEHARADVQRLRDELHARRDDIRAAQEAERDGG